MKKIMFALLAMAGLASATVLEKGFAQGYSSVNANSSDTYTEYFVGGFVAGAYLSGDSDSDLDLYIYDSNGNMICRSETYGDDEYCVWTPSWTGMFKIVVKNRGNVYNRYFLKLQ
jgi:hypothetical protein